MGNEAMTTFADGIDVLIDLYQHGTSDKIYKLSREAFMSLIAAMIDSYGGANNMSSEDTLEMMDQLVSAMKEIHSKLGAM